MRRFEYLKQVSMLPDDPWIDCSLRGPVGPGEPTLHVQVQAPSLRVLMRAINEHLPDFKVVRWKWRTKNA